MIKVKKPKKEESKRQSFGKGKKKGLDKSLAKFKV